MEDRLALDGTGSIGLYGEDPEFIDGVLKTYDRYAKPVVNFVREYWDSTLSFYLGYTFFDNPAMAIKTWFAAIISSGIYDQMILPRINKEESEKRHNSSYHMSMSYRNFALGFLGVMMTAPPFYQNDFWRTAGELFMRGLFAIMPITFHGDVQRIERGEIGEYDPFSI